MYKHNFEVRDYECDIQGIVNNSVYQNYMEHSRHTYMKQIGVNYTELSKQGMDLFAIRIEIDYKAPLYAGDKFYITVEHEIITPLRAVAIQTFYKYDLEKPICIGKCFIAGTNQKGRPTKLTEFGF